MPRKGTWKDWPEEVKAQYRERARKFRLSMTDEQKERYKARKAEYEKSVDRKAYKSSQHLKYKYNLTLEEYEKMAEAQQFKCGICGELPETMLYVDHSHETNTVRGLLCRECNAGLGFFKDDPEVLRRAARYVEND